MARQLGGILIKNTITNQNNEDYLQNFWPSVADEYKAQIRQNTLGSLGSGDIQIIRVASQAVAAVARYDLPANHWPEILGILV